MKVRLMFGLVRPRERRGDIVLVRWIGFGAPAKVKSIIPRRFEQMDRYTRDPHRQ